MLELLGTYRVISRRALVEFAFDGHPFAASRTLTSLEKRGFVEASTVARAAGAGMNQLSPPTVGTQAALPCSRRRTAAERRAARPAHSAPQQPGMHPTEARPARAPLNRPADAGMNRRRRARASAARG